MTELELFGSGDLGGVQLFDCPDAWPLCPLLPLHRDEAEVGVLIAAPGFPRGALVLVNMQDPILRRVLAFEDMGGDRPEVIIFDTPEAALADGWSLGAFPGYGLEHMRDWDRRTEPCPHCDGRGYKGLATLAVPCHECEASGQRVIR